MGCGRRASGVAPAQVSLAGGAGQSTGQEPVDSPSGSSQAPSPQRAQSAGQLSCDSPSPAAQAPSPHSGAAGQSSGQQAGSSNGSLHTPSPGAAAGPKSRARVNAPPASLPPRVTASQWSPAGREGHVSRDESSGPESSSWVMTRRSAQEPDSR